MWPHHGYCFSVRRAQLFEAGHILHRDIPQRHPKELRRCSAETGQGSKAIEQALHFWQNKTAMTSRQVDAPLRHEDRINNKPISEGPVSEVACIGPLVSRGCEPSASVVASPPGLSPPLDQKANGSSSSTGPGYDGVNSRADSSFSDVAAELG